MAAFIADTANFACYKAPDFSSIEEGVAYKFGFDFHPKGNFTFTWSKAVNINLISHLSHYLLDTVHRYNDEDALWSSMVCIKGDC